MTKFAFLVSTALAGVLVSGGFFGAFAAEKKIISVPGRAPSPNYSNGIQVGDTIYVSGNTGNDPKTGKVPEEFEAEVRQCFENIGAILKAGGADFSDIVAVTVYLTDMDLFQRMNAVYTGILKEPRPTRTTVGVAKLVGTSRIEITVVARK